MRISTPWAPARLTALLHMRVACAHAETGDAAGFERELSRALGRPDRAGTAFRTIADSPDPVYRRNAALYTVYLAEATRRQGEIDDAAAIALGALPTVTTLRSARIGTMYAGLRTALGKHAGASPTARDFAEAYDEALPR